jgi:hypothetical protein
MTILPLSLDAEAAFNEGGEEESLIEEEAEREEEGVHRGEGARETEGTQALEKIEKIDRPGQDPKERIGEREEGEDDADKGQHGTSDPDGGKEESPRGGAAGARGKAFLPTSPEVAETTGKHAHGEAATTEITLALNPKFGEVTGEMKILEDFATDRFVTADLAVMGLRDEEALAEESRVVRGCALKPEGVDSGNHDDVEKSGELLGPSQNGVVGADGMDAVGLVGKGVDFIQASGSEEGVGIEKEEPVAGGSSGSVMAGPGFALPVVREGWW